MQSIKKTFTLPKNVNVPSKADLSQAGSNNMMLYTLMNSLQEQKKQDFLAFLSTMPRTNNFSGVQSEDIMREIRSGRAQDIIAHS